MEHWKNARRQLDLRTSKVSKLKSVIDRALELDRMFASQQKHSFAATFGTASRRVQDVQSATPHAYDIRPAKLPPIQGGFMSSQRLAYTYLPYKDLLCTIPNDRQTGATKFS